MKTLKERVAIEQRAADGELIQWVSKIYPEWQTIGHSVDDSFVFWWEEKDYRIKPEPMEFYVSIWESGELTITKTYGESPADIKTIKVREVIE